MLKDLTDVFKKRWPEMVLIAGFMAIGMYLFEQVNAVAASAQSPDPITMSQTTSFMYSMGTMIFFVLFLWLYLGFLATLNVNYDTPHDPAILVKIGRIFFWRLIRFQIIFGVYCLALTFLIFSPMKFLLFGETGSQNMLRLAFHISSIIAAAVLAKPLLLIQPIMICKNLMVLPAIKEMTNYRISDIKILPVIFVAGMLLAGAIMVLQDNVTPNSMIFNVIFAAKVILAGAITLLTGMIGVWFVAGRRFGALMDTTEEPPPPEES